MEICHNLCYNSHKRRDFFMKIWKEFKEFAFKGNVIDMAVGVMIGSAFTAIVNSLVKDVFTPLISLLTKGIDFQTLSITLAGEGETALLLTYGAFIQAVINFFLVAICIFIFVKFINKLRAKKAEEPAPAPAPARKCPFCMSEIDDAATRCPHCTSQLN